MTPNQAPSIAYLFHWPILRISLSITIFRIYNNISHMRTLSLDLPMFSRACDTHGGIDWLAIGYLHPQPNPHGHPLSHHNANWSRDPPNANWSRPNSRRQNF